MTIPIDIRPDHLKIVQGVLKEYLPNNTKVCVFGSRAKWNATDASDLDLALVGKNSVDDACLSNLEIAFEESILPYCVDVVNLDSVDDEFRRIVEEQMIPFPIIEKSESVSIPRKSLVADQLPNTNLSEWSFLTIDEVANVVGGGTPKSSDPNNFDGNIPWITPKDISNLQQRTISTGQRNLSEKGLSACSARVSPANSVLLSTRAPVGYLAISKNPSATNQGIKSLIPRKGFDYQFLYYWLKNNINELHRHATGSTFQELTAKSLKQIQIKLPQSISEQRVISHAIEALDNKIDVNRQMNHTLESIAKELFKSWFIDFGPVQAKIQGRDTGLPKEIEDLFPSQMVDSEFGLIPEGWSFWSVAELAECCRNNLTPYKQPDTVFEYYSYPAYSAGQIPFSELGSSIKSSKYLLPLNSVLLGKLDPTKQKVWFPNNPDSKPQIATTEFLPFTPLKGIGRALIYQLFKSDRFGSVYKVMVTGTSHQRVPLDAILRITCMGGNISIFEKFERIVFPMLMKVLSNRREIARLVNLRDTLLPKLISGDLRIPDMNQDLD